MTGLAQLLDVLGRDPTERLSVNVLNGAFRSTVTTVAKAPGAADPDYDCWYGTGVLHRRVSTGRGNAVDVVGIRELFADLDVKTGGLPSYGAAEQVVEALAGMLGSPPAAIVHSGHGLQPHWRLERGLGTDWADEHDPEYAAATALLRHWGALVKHVAGQHGGDVDNVYDLARVLRVPGSVNCKDPDAQVRVTVDWPDSTPVSLDRLREVLDASLVPSPAGVGERTSTTPIAPLQGALADLDALAALGVHPYAAAAIAGELAKLDGCSVLGWAKGAPAWNSTTYEVACNLQEFANSPWSGYTEEQARRDLFGRAPTDEGFGSLAHKDRWDSAFTKVAGGGRQPPNGEHPSDVFGVVDDEVPGEVAARLVSGGAFIYDTPKNVPAIWGSGKRVVWADGEALTLAGPAGVGKTTVAGQLVRALIVGSDVLGMPVKPTESKVLYLAMDRPQQIARALRRTLEDVSREVLDERLGVWKGPPLKDLARHPETLLALVRLAGADTVVIDSIKDAAIGLSDDVVGAGYNRARQLCIANGVQVLELHHMVKKGENGAKPTHLADLYGSVWIAAGSGSVVLLWGEAGDPIVQWLHLKQPAEEVGPFKVLHDHDTGTSSIWNAADLWALAKGAGRAGITARDAAQALFDTQKPTDAQVQKARRRLDSYVRDLRLDRHDGDDTTQRATTWTVPGADPAEDFL